MLRRGYIYSVALDKRRPALLLSPDARALACATQEGEGGLTGPSVLLCEQITTVPKDCLDATPLGGPLSSARLGEVERAVLRAIGVP